MRRYMISSRREDFEIGARLLAALAFPHVTEARERRKAAEAWCAAYIRRAKLQMPWRAKDLDAAFPRYARIDERSGKKALRKTRSRLRNRQVAGRMTRGFFQEWIDRRPAVLPTGMARLSINELAKLVGREGGQHDPENTEKRIWALSRPVFHVASAVDLVSRFRLAENDNEYDLNDGEMHRQIIELAQASEQVVEIDPRFHVRSDDLLRIRLR